MLASLRAPILFSKPIFVWLGFLALILLVFEILVGHQVIKLPFKTHTWWIMLLLVVVVLIHAVFAVLYFF